MPSPSGSASDVVTRSTAPLRERLARLGDAAAGQHLDIGHLAREHVADQLAHQLGAVHDHHPRRGVVEMAEVVIVHAQGESGIGGAGLAQVVAGDEAGAEPAEHARADHDRHRVTAG